MTSSQKTLSALMLGYVFWVLVGLFTFQWPVFLLILMLSFIPKGKYVFLRWLDSVLTLSALLFIIVNAYHLHIDVFNVLFNP